MPDEQEAQQLDSFIDIDTSDIPEAKVLPEGEQRVRLKGCVQQLSKPKEGGGGNNPMIVATYTIPSEPMVEDIRFYVNLPTPDMDERSRNRAGRGFATWKEAHGLPQSGKIDLTQIGNSGIEVYVHLTIEEYQGTPSNKISRFIRKAS